MTMKHILIAVISGILVMFSFPTVLFGWHAPDLGMMGWVALVPLFVIIARATPTRSFLLTFIAGLVWFGGSLYWVFRALHVYGGIDSGLSVAITFLLVVIMAAYVALAPLLARWIALRWGGEMIVFVPVLWVAIEYARTHVPMGGFPWSSIAMSQWSMLVPLQIVDLVGIYGLIFVMVWVNWCIAELILAVRGEAMRWIGPKVVATVLLIIFVGGYGLVRLHTLPGDLAIQETVSVGIVQGNIPQEEKWSGARALRNLNIYRRATAELFDAGVDIVIWPEASFEQRVSDAVTSADPRVFGLPADVVGTLPAIMIGVLIDGQDNTVYNSALLFDAQGKVLGRYDKTHLVPFGEYVPYQRLFFFAKKLVAPAGDFKAGAALEPLTFPKGVIGPLICYEDVFPAISRDLTLRGATLLVNLTNDAWYGVSSAPYQHMALAVFRAVENRRYMIRSTNTGVSTIIEPSGEILMDSPLFERSLLVGAVDPVTTRTFYTENGDWFAVACVIYAALGVVVALVLSVRRRRKEQS